MFRPNSIMDLEIGHEMCSAKVGKSGIEIQSGKEGFGAAPAQHGAQHQRRGHPERSEGSHQKPIDHSNWFARSKLRLWSPSRLRN